MVSRHSSQIGLVNKLVPVLFPSHLPILVFRPFLVILWIISSVVAFGYWSCVGLIFLLLLWSRFILILFILRCHSLFMNIFALFYPSWTYYIYFILCHFCGKKRDVFAWLALFSYWYDISWSYTSMVILFFSHNALLGYLFCMCFQIIALFVFRRCMVIAFAFEDV